MNNKSLKKQILPLEIHFSNKNLIWWHFQFGKRSYYFTNISSKPNKNPSEPIGFVVHKIMTLFVIHNVIHHCDLFVIHNCWKGHKIAEKVIKRSQNCWKGHNCHSDCMSKDDRDSFTKNQSRLVALQDLRSSLVLLTSTFTLFWAKCKSENKVKSILRFILNPLPLKNIRCKIYYILYPFCPYFTHDFVHWIVLDTTAYLHG